MAMRIAAPTLPPGQATLSRATVPASLLNACFVLSVVIVSFFPAAYFAGGWIYDANGLGIPTDFVNVWAAGRLVLEGHPALAYDWDVQKHIELSLLQQDFSGYFAWHYPPPFLVVATLLAQLPYSAAFIGWVSVSLIPYLAVMRAIVGRAFGLMLALAFPMVLSNALVGQNGFLTAALIGGTLYLLPTRPVLAGICLGLLTYKPQYGLLFPIVLIAAAQWRVFFSAAVTAVALAFVSWLVFGTESWQAFFHWMPMFSQAFLSEGKAPWWKLQSLFSLVRYFGGSESLAWTFQWILTAAVAVTLATIWRSSARYSLKAAALAVGALLTTPYLFMYDMVVLAIPIAWLVRLGLAHGFRAYELSALAVAMAFVLIFIFSGLPLGFATNVIVGALVLRRAGPWWRQASEARLAAPATA
ncbi:glycosyltransferase family 87 protein [Bradyrhizobium sp. STM 3562]|uniref:glycosyltransferase family 87 protein n=1 Tax=Bradyrhizobium sp. STM 3562 TaxID=578924 RepID=UPI00388E8080